MIKKDPTLEWTKLVESLLNRIQEWSEKSDWLVDRKTIELREEELGPYETYSLVIQTSHGRLIVEPKARHVLGADGRVDLYAWPSLNRFLILRAGDQWKLRTASGVDWPKRWGKKTFLEVAAELASA